MLSCRWPELPSSEKQILSFALPSCPSATVNIDEPSGIVNVSVAYGSVLLALTPAMGISHGATIVPAASVAQDFSRNVTYTVTAADGSQKVYVVKVSVRPQATPVIIGFSKNTVRAGDTVDLIGKYFDGVDTSIHVAISGASGQEIKMNFKLVDSVRLSIVIPSSVEPGAYCVKMVKGDSQAVSSDSLLVRLALPIITSTKRTNILEGDTLLVEGRFLWPEKYDYRMSLLGNAASFDLFPIEKLEAKLVVPLYDKIAKRDVPPGKYKLSVVASEPDTRTEMLDSIRVYSNKFPFVTGFLQGQNTYRASQMVGMLTSGFENLAASYCQVQFLGQGLKYHQDAVYSMENEQLLIGLPADIVPGAYMVRIIYLSDTGSILYDQDLDDVITIVR